MIATTAEPDAWNRRRWVSAVLLILVVQVGFILWLGRHPKIALKSSAPPVTIHRLPAAAMNWPGIENAALFVLPNARGFSGNAWLQAPPFEPEIGGWTEPPRPLTLATDHLATGLFEFNRTNLAAIWQLTPRPEPSLETLVAPATVWAGKSTYTLEGQATERVLVTPFQLQSQPWTELLTNTVVQAALDRDGTIFSAAVLGRSGSREADNEALRLVQDARFEPLHWNDSAPEPAGYGRLQWIRFVFHWHTVPTNSVATTP